jgi:GNAT superfamily N-acetyltransferase
MKRIKLFEAFVNEKEGDETAGIKVKVTTYKEYLVIETIDPKKGYPGFAPQGLGSVLMGTKEGLGLSKEAYAWLKTVRRGSDDMGDVDAWKAGDKWAFGWYGGLIAAKSKENCKGSNSYKIEGIEHVEIPNETSKVLMDTIDGWAKEAEEQEKMADQSVEEGILPFLKLPEGYTTVTGDDINVSIIKDNKEAGFFRFSGISDVEGTDYILAETIFLEPEHRRKGIYGAIINAALTFAKKSGRAEGVASYPFDPDMGEIPRSKDADAFWEDLVKKKKAKKQKTEDGIVYTISIDTL